MDPSSVHLAAEAAARNTRRPGDAVAWRRWMPGRDTLVAWLAAVAAVTVCIDFAATF